MNFFYKTAEIKFMLIPYSLAFIAILIIAFIITHLIQRKNKKNKDLENKITTLKEKYENEITTLKEELQRQTYLKEKYENQIVASELSHGRTKNKQTEKQNKILIADKINIINEIKFIIDKLQPNEDYKGKIIIEELQNIINTYKD